MTKQRLMYTLLYSKGQFIQSRNFRRQRVGDLGWLADVYGFDNISRWVDELILLNVSDDPSWADDFLDTCSVIASGFFAPIAVGGGIRSLADAQRAIGVGAEKVVVNTVLDGDDVDLLHEIADTYGKQALVGSIDLKRDVHEGYVAYVQGGSRRTSRSAVEHIARAVAMPIGEVLLGSIDQDGTGMGFDLDTLDLLPDGLELPVVICGGAGNQRHLHDALGHQRVDGVATANLLNFVGDGLQRAREWLTAQPGVDLAHW